jgi:hypothetical protein
MTVTVVSRWTTPNVPASTALAKRSKAIWLKHGAQDARLNQVFTGQFAGQHVFVVVHADMAAYGKTQIAANASPEMQQLVAENQTLGAMLQEREILVGVDL